MPRDYVRAKAKDTKVKKSVIRSTLGDVWVEVDEPALDRNGHVIPDEYPAPKSPSNQSGQKATTTKEKS